MIRKSIILIGMPGSGKSTIGVLLAKAVCRDFLDSDLLIQRRERMPLQQIINRRGNEFLRMRGKSDPLDSPARTDYCHGRQCRPSSGSHGAPEKPWEDCVSGCRFSGAEKAAVELEDAGNCPLAGADT